MSRHNLTVKTRKLVTRILFDGQRAIGVELAGGRRILGGQVILSGGSINSPQLLQLSGVGNAAELGALGIDVVHDLPGVGEHLQDHLEVYIQYKSTEARVDATGAPDLASPVHRRELAVPPERPGGNQPLRGWRLRPGQRRRGLPQPDVPLPAAVDPL